MREVRPDQEVPQMDLSVRSGRRGAEKPFLAHRHRWNRVGHHPLPGLPEAPLLTLLLATSEKQNKVIGVPCKKDPTKTMKRYLFYLIRWQASTFILAPVAILLSSQNKWIQIAVGNLIGGMLFFWIDRLIFKKNK